MGSRQTACNGSHFFFCPKKMVKSESFRRDYNYIPVRNAIAAPCYERDRSKHLISEVNTVMAALGGVLTTCEGNGRSQYWQFDFDALDLVHEVAALGFTPDAKSHQFYPTPAEVSEQVVEMLEITDADTILEPSAG